MLSEGYTQRMTMQSIVEFIKNGGELNRIDPGSPLQRRALYDAALTRYVRRVARLETGSQQWKQLSADERTKRQEDEGDKLYYIIAKISRLDMEIGVLTGMRLFSQLAELGTDFPMLPPPPPIDPQAWAKETEKWIADRQREGPDPEDDEDE